MPEHSREQHELEYAGAARNGAEVWQCPRCGHRIVTRWWPSFQAEVLAEGDPRAVHTGSPGAAMASRSALRGPAAPLTTAERSWLSDNGIAWEGPGDENAA